MTDHQPLHVFISYVRENQEQVDRLCQDMESHGVNVWLDRHSIKPGSDFRDAIRGAIQEGHFFIACFSDEYTSKAKPYMNNELMVAIDELLQYTRPWFIPVKLSKGEVPNLRISSDKTLKDLQYVELHENWDAGINDILSVIKPIPPEIQNLTSALRSEDRDVRASAVLALGKIGPEPKAAVPALIEALKDEYQEIRWHAANTLTDIGPDAKAAVPALIEALKDDYWSVRQPSAQALGKIGPEAKAAVPALIKALKDDDGNVRRYAAKALKKINTPEARKALEEYYKKSN